MSIATQITTMMAEFKTVFGVDPTKVVMSEETLLALAKEVKPFMNYSYKFTTVGKNEIMGLEVEIVDGATYVVVK